MGQQQQVFAFPHGNSFIDCLSYEIYFEQSMEDLLCLTLFVYMFYFVDGGFYLLSFFLCFYTQFSAEANIVFRFSSSLKVPRTVLVHCKHGHHIGGPKKKNDTRPTMGGNETN